MTCASCIQLTSGTPIQTAAQLRAAIDKISDATRAGVLKYEGAGKSGTPFAPLAAGGHWDDFVNNYFSCVSCGQLFHLHAETYHGSGGAFEKVQSIDEPV